MKLALVLVLGAVVSCGSKRAPVPTGGDPRPRPAGARPPLERELEASVLEAYSHLTLGNFEPYADNIAEGLDLMFFGTGSRNVIFGPDQGGSWIDHRPFGRSVGLRLFSKNLRVAISEDAQVGWVSDEISYRVPHRFRLANGAEIERIASIPIRTTSLYLREVDRYVLVLEHLSYPLPERDIVELARGKELRAPVEIPKTPVDDAVAAAIKGTIQLFHGLAAGDPMDSLSARVPVSVFLPTPMGEVHDARQHGVPYLQDLVRSLNGEAKLRLTRHRIVHEGTMAWVAANLEVSSRVGNDSTTIRLRGTYLLEKLPGGPWRIVQVHISVPLEQAQIDERVFGAPEQDAM
ncbi:MAG TPA: nuclear transport factor 2 family protein [Kofleriaceae bacterium]|nr:nuclear transport factor 2 family protein [Kofleriaceae bacterium]